MSTRSSSWLSVGLLAATTFADGCTLGDSSLKMTIAEGAIEADGTTLRSVKVCNESTEPAKAVTVVLVASAGEWLLATGENTKTLSVDLTDTETGRCRTEQWRPPRVAGAVRFEAKVGDSVLVSADRVLGAARVKAVELTVAPPVLPREGGATLKVGVGVTTEGGGLATNGTRIVVQIVETDPVGIAALTDGPIVVGTRDTVDLLVADTSRGVKLSATYEGEEGRRDACRVVNVTGGASGLKCQ